MIRDNQKISFQFKLQYIRTVLAYGDVMYIIFWKPYEQGINRNNDKDGSEVTDLYFLSSINDSRSRSKIVTQYQTTKDKDP